MTWQSLKLEKFMTNQVANKFSHVQWPSIISTPEWPLFCSPGEKKSYLKQPLQNVILQRNGKQCIKNKCLSGYINAYKNWTFTFKKGLSNYPSGAGAGLPIQGPRFKSAGWLQDQGYFSISSLQS